MLGYSFMWGSYLWALVFNIMLGRQFQSSVCVFGLLVLLSLPFLFTEDPQQH